MDDRTRQRVANGFWAERMQFRTAKELCNSPEAQVSWVVRPWVAEGCITELDGPAKSAGKTTFALAMAKAVVEGSTFLGEQVQKGRVVFLSEQSASTLTTAVRRAGLAECPDLYILLWHQAASVPWETQADTAARKCQDLKARLLIVDTLPQFAGLDGEKENSSGEALKVMRPLQQIRGKGIAVLIVRHDRKSGGEPGHSARGSSAFAGAVDIILQLGRPQGHSDPSVRVLKSLSRFSDETPSQLTIQLTAEGYVALGHEGSPTDLKARQALKEALPSTAADALTMEQLEAQTRLSRSSLQRALDATPHVGRMGNGVKGDPLRYYQQIPSAQNTPLTEGQHPESTIGVGPLSTALISAVPNSNNELYPKG